MSVLDSQTETKPTDTAKALHPLLKCRPSLDPRGFQAPDTLFQPTPFWAINYTFDPEELGRQFEELRGKGFGGAFYHSRPGLPVEYLGRQWFEGAHAALEMARKTNGYLWLYDEDLWPSGNAGGYVTQKHPEFRLHALQVEFVAKGEAPLKHGEARFARAFRLKGRKGHEVESIEPITQAEAQADSTCERIIFILQPAPRSDRWGGEYHGTLINPHSVRAFIEETHERYRAEMGEDFGGVIPGIFTDEPNIGQTSSSLPWWDGMPDVYREWTGRDFWEDLPWFYLDPAPSIPLREKINPRKVRLLIHRCYLRQFTQSFSRQLYEWCERNGLALTGHFFEEYTVTSQVFGSLGGIMAHYRYQHIPGYDHLLRQLDGDMPVLLSALQVRSAVRQLDRPAGLVENFGVSGHSTSFEDFKWLSDADLLLGASFFCPHHSWYTLKGRNKIDCPPNWNYQQTYWEDLNHMTDYVSRVGYLMRCGKAAPQALVLHPVEGVTADHRYGLYSPPGFKRYNQSFDTPQPRVLPPDLPGENLKCLERCDEEFDTVLRAVLGAGYDCDLGDEGYLEDLGEVRGKRLRVGAMEYETVVVPPSQTWRPSTLRLLREFAEAGGRLIFTGALPRETDCEPAEEDWLALLRLDGVSQCGCGFLDIQTVLDGAIEAPYMLRDPQGNTIPKSMVHYRTDGKREIWFVFNADRERGQRYELCLPQKAMDSGRLEQWQAEDGAIHGLEVHRRNGGIYHGFDLPPAGSRLFVWNPEPKEKLRALPGVPGENFQTLQLDSIWHHERLGDNALVMDRFEVSLDDGKSWWPEEVDWHQRTRLWQHFGIAHCLFWQPWRVLQKKQLKNTEADILLRYRFQNEGGSIANCSLVLEERGYNEVTVNGKVLSLEGCGWYWDRENVVVPISHLVQAGENIIEQKMRFHPLTAIEAAHLVGDFGVKLVTPQEAVLTEEPARLRNGSIVNQGYPFFAETMRYIQALPKLPEGKKVWLRLVRPAANLLKVHLNGTHLKTLTWQPWTVELPSHLLGEANTISVDVITSRQNVHGPLHARRGHDAYLDLTRAFEEDSLTDRSWLPADYGLLRGAELLIEP